MYLGFVNANSAVLHGESLGNFRKTNITPNMCTKGNIFLATIHNERLMSE
jgi:hypothetical protein